MTYELDELANIEADILQAESSLAMAKVRMNLLKDMLAKGQAAKPAQVEPPKLALVAPQPPKIEVIQPKPPEPPKVEEPLVINDEWKTVLELLNHGSEHVFVTGDAGTGKSTLLKHFTDNFDGVAAILAPTGVAALRVGGQTIHRFFGFGAHALEDDDIQTVSDTRREKYRAVDLLIIDEISMVRAELMDAVDKFLRKNDRNASKPFGGARLVMFGDLFQLPPVSKEKDEKKWLMGRYGTDMPYFFHAEVWRETPPKLCQLTTIFRQKDPAFTDALNAIRRGTSTEDHLKLINSRVDRGFQPPAGSGDLWLTLTTTNAGADINNRNMLAAIQSDPRFFQATVTDAFDLKDAPTDERLELKVGAAVMFIKNNPGVWVNGTLGKVHSLDPLTVDIKGRIEEVTPETWEKIVYELDEKTKKLRKSVQGKFTQIPLKLAAAITIHKSQGLTFDHSVIDLGYGSFAAGQTYVALSRCRTLDGMVLRKPVQERDLIVSEEVQKFMKGEPIARPAVAAGQLL